MSRVRRQGFPGQHLLVVPTPVRQAVAGHPLLSGLLVTDAGYFPQTEGHRVERPQGSATHLLILCLRGEGWIESAGSSQKIGAGEAVWLPSDTAHRYGASAREPWKILWAHFRGTEVVSWQRELGWAMRMPFGGFRFGPERIGAFGLEKVYAALEHGYSTPHLLAASCALRAAFCAMLEHTRMAGVAKTAMERVAAVREQIVADPARASSLADLASSSGLSVPHFSKLFRQQSGYAPVDFVIRRRVRLACHLLDSGSATIASIASEAGFADPYYFSRSFRRVMGQSPRAYRKAVKA